MADIAALEGVLDEIRDLEDVTEALLVSRSGMHIAGEVPAGAHLETFVAMSAILLGSAETATSELNDELKDVIVSLKKSKLIIIGTGAKALLLIKTKDNVRLMPLMDDLEELTPKIEKYL